MLTNTANQHVTFQMRDKANPETPITSGTPTITVDLDGVQSTGSGTAPTHIGKGSWDYVPTQAETNGKHVQFMLELTGAIPSVRSFDPYDLSTFKADTSNLDVPVSSRSSHTAAQAGTDAASKVLATPANPLATDSNGDVSASNMRGTDGAQPAVTDVDGLNLEQALRVCLAALAGKLSGAPSGPINIRDQADTKDRISATVDANGNRTAVTVNAT